MSSILILNENRLEREIMQDILAKGLPATAIEAAASSEQALEILGSTSVQLLIADVPSFDLFNCNMISTVKSIAPDVPILVTSVGKKSEIAANVWRLGVQDYLLKPYRPTWLVAAARAMMQEGDESVNNWERGLRERYLRLMADHMQTFCYKKCINTAKDYLDSLYRETDDMDVIRFSALAFVKGMAQLGDALGPTAQLKLSSVLERFKNRFDLQGRRYDTFATIEKMLGIIFVVLDENRSYQVSDEQRVMNYIDRNIKGGVSLDEVAEYANMSSSYFSKLFKKITGVNFIAYVMEGKVEVAKDMLAGTEMPVVNIAYELGYNETNYFSKAFKKRVGLTPTEYREQFQNSQG